MASLALMLVVLTTEVDVWDFWDIGARVAEPAVAGFFGGAQGDARVAVALVGGFAGHVAFLVGDAWLVGAAVAVSPSLNHFAGTPFVAGDGVVLAVEVDQRDGSLRRACAGGERELTGRRARLRR